MRFWDHRNRVADGGQLVADPARLQAELRDAYARGRRDEQLRRRRSPLLTLVVVSVAAVGAMMLFFAAQQGSFTSAGAVVDNKISTAGDRIVQPAVDKTVNSAGEALQQAGQRLKSNGAAAASPSPAQ